MPGEGQSAFLNLFSQKMMNGIFATALPEPAGDISPKAGQTGGKEAPDRPPVAPHANAAISVLVSALAASLEQPAESGSSENDVRTVTDFLSSILDILSDGDEIELKGTPGNKADISTEDAASKEGPGQKGIENTAANSFVGTLAAFLAALNRMARQDTEQSGPRPVEAGISAKGRVNDVPEPQQLHAARPAKTAAPDPAVFVVPEGEVKEKGSEAPAVLVEVTRSVKDNRIVDVSMNDGQKKPVLSAPVTPGEKKDESLPDRPDVTVKEKTEPDRIIIRVAEKKDPDVKNDTGDRPASENSLGVQGNAHRSGEQHKPEMHVAAKNDFSAVMIDKIEKITEQYAGKNSGLDMTVKLKIDDNETILIGLRDEGRSVTVEVKTANENTLNFIQSQKNDLVKNLEDKHIMTTIHVDIDQDAQNRREQGKRRDNGRDSAEEEHDFGNFFEALA